MITHAEIVNSLLSTGMINSNQNASQLDFSFCLDIVKTPKMLLFLSKISLVALTF